jgi:hypothetical protein
MDQTQTVKLTEAIAKIAEEYGIENYIFMGSHEDDFVLDINTNMVGALGLIEFAKLEVIERRGGGAVPEQHYYGTHN